MFAEIIRVEQSAHGVFGVMKLDGQCFCVTLEPPYRNNERNVSSIPTGTYRCKKVQSPRFGTTFEITEVWDRSNVLFHSGNRVKDTEGCVLLAQHFGKLQGDRAVLNSGNTFRAFLTEVRDLDKFPLTIRNAF